LVQEMKKYFLPPFLPILAVLMYLMGHALVEARMAPGLAPTNADGEILRWVMFVPVMVLILYPILLTANMADLVLQEVLPCRWRSLSILLAGGALGAGLCLWPLKGNGPAPYIVCVVSSLAATAAMSFWRNRMAGKIAKTQPYKSRVAAP
jgi:hypothetical protein